MDLKSYTIIILATVVVPCFVVPIVGITVLLYFPESEPFILLLMKGIIRKRNIDKRPTYLICNRKFDQTKKGHFVFISLSILAVCVHVFIHVSIIDVSSECIDDPNLDCFKMKDDTKFFDTYTHHESPVNCSEMSRKDSVICYRITVLDPEKAFAGAATAYLWFKIINFGLSVVAYIILLMTQKLQKATMKRVKRAAAITVFILFVILFLLQLTVHDVRSTFRKMSYTVVLQVIYLGGVVAYFITCSDWGEIDQSEYYEDMSLPDNVAAHTNEIS